MPEYEVAWLNGDPAVLTLVSGKLLFATVLHLDGENVAGVYRLYDRRQTREPWAPHAASSRRLRALRGGAVEQPQRISRLEQQLRLESVSRTSMPKTTSAVCWPSQRKRGISWVSGFELASWTTGVVFIPDGRWKFSPHSSGSGDRLRAA